MEKNGPDVDFSQRSKAYSEAIRKRDNKRKNNRDEGLSILSTHVTPSFRFLDHRLKRDGAFGQKPEYPARRGVPYSKHF